MNRLFPIFPFIALLLVSVFWGSHAIAASALETHMQPVSLSIWRFTFGALCYLPLLFSRSRLGRLRQLDRGTQIKLGIAGLCWSVLYPLFWYATLEYLSPIESLLLVNTSPLIAAGIGWIFLRERLTLRDGLGILVSFFGVILLVAHQWGGKSSTLGFALAILAALSFACYTVTSKSLFQALPLFDVLLATNGIGAVLLWIFALVTGRVGRAIAAIAALPSHGWEELGYIVVVVSVIAYVLYGYGLTRVPAAIGSAVTFYPQALFTALMQWIGLGTPPSYFIWISGLLILGGTALMSTARRSNGRKATGTISDAADCQTVERR
ncbi:DMT family transporter [Alicyclobacillus acidiphilus]|uniref:DMT family transporter n=1 Tax=Alicyclobacillus acidiphilus TaxID=182455 RepID=UPI001FE17210|nr:DMT family transporter [Alicyclobacillus acidiphilus]